MFLGYGVCGWPKRQGQGRSGCMRLEVTPGEAPQGPRAQLFAPGPRSLDPPVVRREQMMVTSDPCPVLGRKPPAWPSPAVLNMTSFF